MAGKKGASGGNRSKPTLSPKVQESLRAQIKTGHIIKRLEKHVNGDLKLQNSQIRAAEILLKKTLPDLQNVQLTGEGGDALKIEIVNGLGNPSAE